MTPAELEQAPELTVDAMQDIIDNYPDLPRQSLLWPWILLALVLAALVGIMIRRWRGRPSREKPLTPEQLFKQTLAQLTCTLEVREFYARARGVINAYIYWKSGCAVESLTDEELGRVMSERGEKVLAPIVARHTQVLFAGQTVPLSVMADDLNTLQECASLDGGLHDVTGLGRANQRID